MDNVRVGRGGVKGGEENCEKMIDSVNSTACGFIVNILRVLTCDEVVVDGGGGGGL